MTNEIHHTKVFFHELMLDGKVFREWKEKIFASPEEYHIIYTKEIDEKSITRRQTIVKVGPSLWNNEFFEFVQKDETVTNVNEENLEAFNDDWNFIFIPALKRNLEEHILFLSDGSSSSSEQFIW